MAVSVACWRWDGGGDSSDLSAAGPGTVIWFGTRSTTSLRVQNTGHFVD